MRQLTALDYLDLKDSLESPPQTIIRGRDLTKLLSPDRSAPVDEDWLLQRQTGEADFGYAIRRQLDQLSPMARAVCGLTAAEMGLDIYLDRIEGEDLSTSSTTDGTASKVTTLYDATIPKQIFEVSAQMLQDCDYNPDKINILLEQFDEYNRMLGREIYSHPTGVPESISAIEFGSRAAQRYIRGLDENVIPDDDRDTWRREISGYCINAVMNLHEADAMARGDYQWVPNQYRQYPGDVVNTMEPNLDDVSIVQEWWDRCRYRLAIADVASAVLEQEPVYEGRQ